MKTFFFATGNKDKIAIAEEVAQQYDCAVAPVSIDIDEIQGEDAMKIVRHKAEEAFKQLGKPVVVSDDFWNIPALGGFPGAYMKSVNHWFTPADFLRLMEGVTDRRVILEQCLAYCDGTNTKIFDNKIPGKIIHEPRGSSPHAPNMEVIVLDADGDKTIAEVFEAGPEAVRARYRSRRDAWHELLDWYKEQKS